MQLQELRTEVVGGFLKLSQELSDSNPVSISHRPRIEEHEEQFFTDDNIGVDVNIRSEHLVRMTVDEYEKMGVHLKRQFSTIYTLTN